MILPLFLLICSESFLISYLPPIIESIWGGLYNRGKKMIDFNQVEGALSYIDKILRSLNTEKNLVKAFIRQEILKKYPNYPIDICDSPEDHLTFHVRVFNTTNRHVKDISELVYSIQERIDHKILLLPMIKNKAVTEKYYSDMLG